MDEVTRARQQALGDLLHRTAARYPAKLAVVAGERRATYAELEQAVNRTAHALAERGVGNGDRLAILAHNCWEYPLLVYATAKLGAVLVPVNFMLNAAEIAYILNDSRAGGIVTEAALVDTAAGRSAPPGSTAVSGA